MDSGKGSNLNHLAQFISYGGNDTENQQKYAEYILYSLIPAFYPEKLQLQKKTFSDNSKLTAGKGLNKRLFDQIFDFYKIIHDFCSQIK